MKQDTPAPGFFHEDGSWPLIKRLVAENFREYALRYGLALVFMILVAGSTAFSAWIMKDVVENLFVKPDFEKIVSVAMLVVLIFTVKGFATYAQIVTLARVGNAIVAKLQMRLYEKILAQGGGFYSKYPSHDLVTRIGKNAQGARLVIELIMTSLGRDLLTLVGLVIVMVLQDPVLTLLSLVVVPPIVIIVTSLVRRVRKVAQQLFNSSVEVVGVMQDTVTGIKIVKSFALEPEMRRRMGSVIDRIANRNNKIAGLTARTSPVMETLGGVCIGLMILYAGWRTTTTGQTPSSFMAFLTALLFAYEPAKRIARLHINMEAGLVGARLMYEILDRPLEITDRDDAKPLVIKHGKVTFSHVDFSYRHEEGDDLRVLTSIDLTAQGGKTTALVGPSGGGKTTVISLIQRFYDADKGLIDIDGQDIRDVTLASLRQNIAFVSQDTFLFSGTVRQNILSARPDASSQELEGAARDANAHDFIMKLEHGYDTDLGVNGNNLSGGQRQRLAIARALLKDAPIVLLDEATSALDAESEKLVQQAFDRLMKDRTTIVIAHRFSTIRDVDCIHVLQDGKIVESGRHSELIATGTTYKNLHNLQFAEGRHEAAE